MRLGELEREGFIEVVERGRNYSKWDLTAKGKDVLPVLMTLVQFGSKWYASKVFSDMSPRALDDVFDESYIRKIMENVTPSMHLHARGLKVVQFSES